MAGCFEGSNNNDYLETPSDSSSEWGYWGESTSPASRMSVLEDDSVHGHRSIEAEFIRATEATRKLFGAVGVATALPFVTPPAIPYTLEQDFEAGLAEYGLETSSPVAKEQQRLPAIEEKSESEPLAKHVSAPAPADTETKEDSMSPIDNDGQKVAHTSKVHEPLFPSPFSGTSSLASTCTTQKSAGCDGASEISSLAEHNFWSTLFQHQHEDITPQPTNEKSQLPALLSKKRGQSGLHILPKEQFHPSKQQFPGKTRGLLLILSKWSVVMMEFRDRLPHPKSFANHPAFPFRITQPTRKPLISVSFYDTSIQPHKEILFLGPGDVTDIVYAEVDVFRSKGDLANFQANEGSHSISRENLGITGKLPKTTRHMDQANHSMTGEGRWAFVHVKDLKNMKSDETSPPFIMLAWQISAVTSTSACIHTVFPDRAPSRIPLLRRQPASESLRRIVSISNLRNPKQQEKRLYETIRSKSASELPHVNAVSTPPPIGAQTLLRTVIKMEKPGKIPLVEGYRVNFRSFQEWVEAVGKGQGKVVLWTERA